MASLWLSDASAAWLRCLPGATDVQCNRPVTYEYQYKSSRDGQLHPYDPDNPPSDVA